MEQFATWLAATPASVVIQDRLWVVPTVQAVHILAIAMVLSSSGMVALRVFGRAGLRATPRETLSRYMPWLWGALLVLAVTGALLITGEPERSLLNPVFQLKMLLLVVAVAVTIILVRRIRTTLAADQPAGAVLKLIVLINFVLWCAIVFAGRWIAYAVY